MNHSNKIIDNDKCFEVDPITRAIKNQSPTKISVIQYDHNSERFSFVLPRIIEGHDMTECNRVEVHYINNGTAGVYEINDLDVCENDDTKVRCSWLLSQNATGQIGALSFLLRFACVGDDGAVDYAWNTSIFKGISIAEGLYNSETIVEQYADVLEQWKQELENSSGGGGSSAFIVNIDIANDRTVTADKTYSEILKAHSEGKIVQGRNAAMGLVGVLSACGNAQAVFIFNSNDGTILIHCSKNNVWRYELYEVEYAQKDYVDKSIQSAILDSWGDAV